VVVVVVVVVVSFIATTQQCREKIFFFFFFPKQKKTKNPVAGTEAVIFAAHALHTENWSVRNTGTLESER
jgi:hypothetical protein